MTPLDPTRDQVITITVDQVPSTSPSGVTGRYSSSQGHVLVGEGQLLDRILYRLREHNPQSFARYQIIDKLEGTTTELMPLHPVRE